MYLACFMQDRDRSLAKDDNIMSEAFFQGFSYLIYVRNFDLTEYMDPSTAQQGFLSHGFCILRTWNDRLPDSARSHGLR